jgi:hypothetical protein
MNEMDRERLAALLREAMPSGRPALEQDLWPRMLETLHRRPQPVPWLDWALAAGAAGWCAAFPSILSALLYQL